MTDEAASAGFFTSEHFGKFPRVQILTIEDLLGGETLQVPASLERTTEPNTFTPTKIANTKH